MYSTPINSPACWMFWRKKNPLDKLRFRCHFQILIFFRTICFCKQLNVIHSSSCWLHLEYSTLNLYPVLCALSRNHIWPFLSYNNQVYVKYLQSLLYHFIKHHTIECYFKYFLKRIVFTVYPITNILTWNNLDSKFRKTFY